ncbi:response regulator [Rhizorhabdus sp. FW153]|uniref:response regulator n=1 Tax=Rhizorhabdus sp. FW153 TaxID=3400216 RepID=UPI003CEF1C50
MSDPTRILYVDDESDIRLIVKMALKLDPSFDVRTAESGDAALKLLTADAWRPDLAMIDVMMPGMSGPDLLKTLRADARTASIPVVFVTARARPEDVDEYLAAGAVGVITKPFDPLQLAPQVREMLSD